MTINVDKYKKAVEAHGSWAVTGVMNGNDIEWEWIGLEFICLDCEEYEKEWNEEHPDATDEEKDEHFFFNFYCEGHTHLYGDWKLDENDKYEPDRNGSNGYSFIYDSNMNVIQVAWSRILKWAWPCSPCYPGQGDVNEDSGIITVEQKRRLRREMTFYDAGGGMKVDNAWASYAIPTTEEEWELLDALNKEVQPHEYK